MIAYPILLALVLIHASLAYIYRPWMYAKLDEWFESWPDDDMPVSETYL